MCIICVEFEQGKLKLGEAVRNYGEMKEDMSAEHQKEVEEKLFNNFAFYPSQYVDHDYEDYEITGFGD